MQKADAVFEGGGVKGIGLVGALKAFEEVGFEWQNVAGTSIGSIIATLLAVGYDATELREIMTTQVNFRDFMDTAGIGKLPVVGPWLSLLFHQGMYKGDAALNLMRRLIAEKTGKERFTFADLIMPKDPSDSHEDYEKRYKYKLAVIGSDISGGTLFTLPYDVARLGYDPDELEVALAVRMSIGFPFFFRPVKLAEMGNRRKKHWIVDGGMLSNFPIWLFDAPSGQPPTWPTIGFLLTGLGPEVIEQRPIRGLVSMLEAIFRTMTIAHDRKALEETDKQRIVTVPTRHINALDFDLSDADRDWLYNSGYEAAKRFLDAWTFDDYVTQRQMAASQF
jgi:NTE family protein